MPSKTIEELECYALFSLLMGMLLGFMLRDDMIK